MHGKKRALLSFFAFALGLPLVATMARTARAETAAPKASAGASASVNASAAAVPSSADEAEAPKAAPAWDSSDVSEDPTRRYYFVNARAGVGILPSFLINAFVREAPSVVMPSIGIELDTRKDGFAIIPALSYQSFSTSDILLADKTRDPDLAQNWNLVNSSLKGVFATADFLWSSQIHKNASLEYGFGAGLGVLFGDLKTNWVWEDKTKALPGAVVSNNGRHFIPCQTISDGPAPTSRGTPTTSCDPSTHENTGGVNRVGGYTEHGMLNGGGIPPVMPYLSLPEFGVRFKPMKQLEIRLMTGLSLTGLWFSLSGGYGLEQPPAK